METSLNTPSKRKYFLIISILIIVVLMLARYFAIPYFCPKENQLYVITKENQLLVMTSESHFCVITNALLDNVISGSLAALSVAVLAFYLTPRNVRRAGLEITEPREIKRSLEDSRRSADRYWFSGSSGRYTRGVTLPELANSTRSDNTTKEIQILILDPTDRRLCQHYAEYRASLRSASSGYKWTADSVRNESYATILAAYCWRDAQTRLDVRVFLRNSFSIFRSDITTKAAVLTKEDPQEPGLYSQKGSFFYDAFLEDVRISARFSRELSRDAKVSFTDLDPVATREFFKSLGIDSSLTDEELTEIIKLATTEGNPYDKRSFRHNFVSHKKGGSSDDSEGGAGAGEESANQEGQ